MKVKTAMYTGYTDISFLADYASRMAPADTLRLYGLILDVADPSFARIMAHPGPLEFHECLFLMPAGRDAFVSRDGLGEFCPGLFAPRDFPVFDGCTLEWPTRRRRGFPSPRTHHK
jgi:hypothetical protein